MQKLLTVTADRLAGLDDGRAHGTRHLGAFGVLNASSEKASAYRRRVARSTREQPLFSGIALAPRAARQAPMSWNLPQCTTCRAGVSPGQPAVFLVDGRVRHVECQPITCPRCHKRVELIDQIVRDRDGRVLHIACGRMLGPPN